MAETTLTRTTLARAGVQTAEEILAPTPGVMLRRRVFGHFGLMIGAFALLLAVLITGNRLATIYQERLWEMGVMRALGVSRARLVRELLLEAALLAIIAVAFGIPIGIAFAQIIVVPVADTMTLNFKEAVTATWVAPRPLPLVAAAAGGVLSALAAALVPASQAVRKSVVSVLARGRRRDAVGACRTADELASGIDAIDRLGEMLGGEDTFGEIVGAGEPAVAPIRDRQGPAAEM